MSAALVIEDGGLHTTVQDLGRFGFQALGVPVAGALDADAMRLLNALVGNQPGTAVLEYLLGGLQLSVAASSVRIAASTSVHVAGASERTVPAWHSARLRRGERLRLAAPAGCIGGYLAVAGGFALEPVLGSLSTYVRSRIGGLAGRTLGAGDRLPLVRADAPARGERRLRDVPPFAARDTVRVVQGPQAEYFTAEARTAFLGAAFTVTREADRMGLRLQGPRLAHTGGFDIVSDGIVTGAVQVPGSGCPIVLLADHQSTGGYPKIATVVSADLPLLGRLRPGDSLRFHAVSVAEAETLAARHAEDLYARTRALLPVDADAFLDEAALLAVNLISGAVDAME